MFLPLEKTVIEKYRCWVLTDFLNPIVMMSELEKGRFSIKRLAQASAIVSHNV